jgi:NAD(P)H-flavin reductase
MPYKILSKKSLTPITHRIEIDAPMIAKSAKPGQFVVLRTHEKGERFPLTISHADPEKGTITLIFQEVGKSSGNLARIPEGGEILDLLGPLGMPSHTEKVGTVVCVGGGYGNAVLLPVARGYKSAGNKVILIVGFRTKELEILEDELREVSDEFHICTDDGTDGFHGFVTQKLKILLDEGLKPNQIMAIGPLPMMKAVSKLTEPYGIKTFVSLNPIMVDGTGMCGGCRCTIGDKTKFACVDGPDFDGHQVDWDEILIRLGAYKDLEKKSYEDFKCKCAEEAEKQQNAK